MRNSYNCVYMYMSCKCGIVIIVYRICFFSMLHCINAMRCMSSAIKKKVYMYVSCKCGIAEPK